jgi:hypothetical protein
MRRDRVFWRAYFGIDKPRGYAGSRAILRAPAFHGPCSAAVGRA